MATHHLSDYDYNLPEELIAQEPLEDRASSRLLAVDPFSKQIHHLMFRDIRRILKPGDVLVLNNTRVTGLRLLGRKATGAAVEALLLKPAKNPRSFIALLKPGRRLGTGTRIRFDGGSEATVTEEFGDGQKVVEFDDTPDLQERLNEVGRVPLPPYIHRHLEDKERYQTVYAQQGGSAAAPTAGLHFTPELLDDLRDFGVKIAYVTLDVGIDTFRPIGVDDVSKHVMHGELCRVPEETAATIESAVGSVVAVGTTVVRTLETFARGPRKLAPGEQESKLFIHPGFKFQVVDAMFTNFHMPKTTMMLMISALAGRELILHSYQEAVREKYRFLSFGDSMFIGKV